MGVKYCFCYLVYVLFLSLYLRGKEKEKEKERKRKRKHAIVFYVFALLSRSSLFGYAKSIFVRYCATHTLTYCRALFERSEFARLKKLDVVQNYKPQPNGVRMMRTLACFSFFLFYFSSSFCLANKRKKKSRIRLKNLSPCFLIFNFVSY